MMMKILFLLVGFLTLFNAQVVAQPLESDSRIRTLVYSENNVYRIFTAYGYQSNIEFGRGEEIETLSVGDQVGWQIVPAGRRLFIRPLELGARTNMTVVTNKRAYQFDLNSAASEKELPKDVAYVVRFYYPSDEVDSGAAPVASASQLIAATASSANYPSNNVPSSYAAVRNLRYTYDGPAKFAPLKIYDNKTATYFRLPPVAASNPPTIFAVNAEGEVKLSATNTPDGYVMVPVIAKQFILSYANGAKIKVFNEAFNGNNGGQ